MQKSGSFLTKYSLKLAKNLNNDNIKAQILSTSEEDLKKGGQLIKEGKLVAFPTETVYGLGANALDKSAILSIFETKKRPLTDPVIVHVTDIDQAMKLVDISESQALFFKKLSTKFWPGPLTIILKANELIPDCVTAGTGYVGIRCPNNEIALKLIKFSNCPIAAPSANLFSHVSPTSSIHVFNDLYESPIYIIDGENSLFGVESTVIKILENNDIIILRNGSVSSQAIKNFLSYEEQYTDVLILHKDKNISEEHKANEAPGQLLKHYSPLCETFLLEIKDNDTYNEKIIDFSLKNIVLIDFGNVALKLKNDVLDYFNLSEKGDLLEAMNKLYDALRWAENIEGVKCILITNLEIYYKKNSNLPEFYETVYDKTYRSSSGKKIIFDINNKEFYKH